MANQLKHTAIRPLLSLTKVAKILGVHRTTVSRYAYAGLLRCAQFGKRLMFEEQDVADFIESRKQLFDNRVSAGFVMGKENYGNCQNSEIRR